MKINNVLVLSNLKDLEKDKLVTNFKELTFNFIKPKEVLQSDIDDADIIIGNPNSNLNVNNDNLKMLQLNSAGSDYYIKEGILNKNTRLANASGSYGKAIAEHSIGMILALNKNFKSYFRSMDQHTWKPIKNGKELYNSTVLIVGLGDLGYELAKRLKAFNTHIIALKRTPSSLPKNIDELYTIDHLDEILPRVDYVILALPQSPATINIINKERLLLMKQDATLINVGRGSAINETDLIEVLDLGHLHGVGLDVTVNEPLDQDNKLWTYDNVFITPHTSGGFEWDSVRKYFVDLTIRNINHLLNNEELENSVDFTTGYRKINTAI